VDRLEIPSLPVSPFMVAEEEEISVQAKDVDEPGVSGILVRVGNEFGIVYASHIRNEGFIRFTVAHELGHYFLPGHPEHLFPSGGGQHLSRAGLFNGDPYEKEADYFAAALLMPRSLFVPALRAVGEGFPAIKKLANSCMTSLTATAIRYAEFADDPVAVVLSSPKGIEFCVLSQCLRDVPGLRPQWKGELVPPMSKTAKFNSDPENIRQCREAGAYSSLDDWFEGAPEVETKEDVVGLGRYGRTLTVLFTEQPLPDPDEDH